MKITGAQLLNLSRGERRSLRRKKIHSARYEKKAIHDERLRRKIAKNVPTEESKKEKQGTE